MICSNGEDKSDRQNEGGGLTAHLVHLLVEATAGLMDGSDDCSASRGK